jgi:hypothetical protein
MKHKLIKTDNYLLVVDDSEIKVGDYITDKYRVWQWEDDSSLLGRYKIIAHLPLNGSPILEGVDLLPPYSRHQEDGLEELAEMNYPMCEWAEEQCLVRRLAFKNGYRIAKETLYTEEQVRESIEMAYMFGQAGHFVGEGELCIKEIIQSLKQSKKD